MVAEKLLCRVKSRKFMLNSSPLPHTHFIHHCYIPSWWVDHFHTSCDIQLHVHNHHCQIFKIFWNWSVDANRINFSPNETPTFWKKHTRFHNHEHSLTWMYYKLTTTCKLCDDLLHPIHVFLEKMNIHTWPGLIIHLYMGLLDSRTPLSVLHRSIPLSMLCRYISWLYTFRLAEKPIPKVHIRHQLVAY